MTSMEYSVKVSFNEEMRRFTSQGCSFKGLYDQIVELLGLEKNVDFVVRYTDEDGDLITMSSDIELKAAVVPGKLLRLIICRKNETPCVLPVNPPASSAPVAPQAAPAQGPALAASQIPAPAPVQVPVPIPVFVPAPAPAGGEPFRHRGWRGQHKHAHKGENWAEMKAQRWAERKAARFAAKNARMGEEGKTLDGVDQGRGPKLVARHVKDVTVADGTEIAANTPFVKTWRMRNEGAAWPAGCVLLYVSRNGDDMSGPKSVPVPFEGPVPANQEVDISVSLVAPGNPGRYIGYWRLSTPEGRKFGQRVWVSIVVPSGSSDETHTAVPEKYEELVDVLLGMGFEVKKRWVLRLLQKHEGDVNRVADILTKRGKAFCHGHGHGRKDHSE